MLTRLAQSGPTTVWFGLWDKVCAARNLQTAFQAVWRNRGEPGVDEQTVQQFDREAVSELARLGEELRTKGSRTTSCWRWSNSGWWTAASWRWWSKV